MKVLRKTKIGAARVTKRFRTLTIQIETAVMFVLATTVTTAVLMKTPLV